MSTPEEDTEVQTMRSMRGLSGDLAGAILMIIALTRSLRYLHAGANHDVFYLVAWVLVAGAGVYVLNWGLLKYLMGDGSKPDRPTPPEWHAGSPSSQSKARNRPW